MYPTLSTQATVEPVSEEQLFSSTEQVSNRLLHFYLTKSSPYLFIAALHNVCF